MPLSLDTLWTNATLATMNGRGDYGLLRGGAVGVAGERIAWVGAQADLAPDVREATADVVDCASSKFDAGWHLIAAVDDCRGAGDEQDVEG